MPGGEEGIDFSASLQRRDGESGKSLTTDCSSDKHTCVMSTDRIMRMSSETGVPILELDAMSPVTKNSVQISSEKPHYIPGSNSLSSGY